MHTYTLRPLYGGRKLQPKQSCAFNNNILFRYIRIPTIGFLEYAIHTKCIRVGRSVAECIDASLVLYLFCYDFFCCCCFFVILITATTTYLIKLTGIKISRDRKCARVKIRRKTIISWAKARQSEAMTGKRRETTSRGRSSNNNGNNGNSSKKNSRHAKCKCILSLGKNFAFQQCAPSNIQGKRFHAIAPVLYHTHINTHIQRA